jgi:hypothetical protein
MGAVMNRHRPSLWAFIRAIKDEESVTSRSALAASRSIDPPRRKLKYRKLDERISVLKQQFHTGAITLNDYWKSVTYVIVRYS